jgi:cyanate lyase
MNDAKTELGQRVLAIKQQKGLSWNDLATRRGHAPVWTCAACLGQMSRTAETSARLARSSICRKPMSRCCRRLSIAAHC